MFVNVANALFVKVGRFIDECRPGLYIIYVHALDCTDSILSTLLNNIAHMMPGRVYFSMEL